MIKVGEKFDRLTVIEEMEQRSKDGRKVYKCKCICGNVVNIRSKELLNGDTRSCGCLQKEKLAKRYWNKTQPDRIFSNNLNKNNKSGIKGICWDKSRKKWIATMQYQGKHYNLGRFNTILEAEKAREKFEKKIKVDLVEKV